jgi:hypothetical protein
MAMEYVLVNNILVWAGVVVLFFLCLPSVRISQLILEISARLLRLALLAVLGGGICLWFLPGMAPVILRETFYSLPEVVQAYFPAPGSSLFGLALAALIVLTFLPALAVLDTMRHLAGQRLKTLRDLADSSNLPLPANTSHHSPHRSANRPHVSREEAEPSLPSVEARTMAQRRKPPVIADYDERTPISEEMNRGN